MTDTMDTSNPVPVQPSGTSYRVMRKDREKERQRRFDPLFKDAEDEENGDAHPGRREAQKRKIDLEDTFESKNSNGVKKIEKPPKKDEDDEKTPDSGSLVDVKA